MGFLTEQEAYHRLRWDPRFDVRRCQVVITLRPSGTQRMPYLDLDVDVVPWHRLVELWVDDELAWSRPARVDRLDELAARATPPPATAATSHALPPHRFDGWVWVPEVAKTSAEVARLRVVTWNLLFDRHDAELLRSDERWQDALDRLGALDADVLVLVEITPKMWPRVLAQRWVRGGYAVSHGPDAGRLEPFGQAVLSRSRIRSARVIELARERTATIATIDAGGGANVGVAAIHLTSERVDGAAAIRAAQLATVLEQVRATPRDAWIIAGDFNATPDEHDRVLALAGAVDAWRAVHGDRDGFTYDPARNTIAGALSKRGRSVRLDRVMTIAGRVALAPVAAELAGIEHGSYGLPPSDHYAVCADLAVERGRPVATSRAAWTKRTALAIVPPRELWGAIQRVRCAHDRGFARWPPHVTLFHPFVDEAWLERAADVIATIAAAVEPFDLELDRVAPIDAKGRTIVMLASRRTARALDSLRASIVAELGDGRDDLDAPDGGDGPGGGYRDRARRANTAREFRPHLTIARDVPRDDIPDLTATFRVDRLVILRERDGRFGPDRELLLGRPQPRARSIGSPVSLPVPAIVERIREAAEAIDAGVAVEPFGSAVYAPAHARDVDVLVHGGVDVAMLAESLGLAVAGPTSLRGTLANTAVDVTVVPRGGDARLLAGPVDARRLVDHLEAHGRRDAFLAIWPEVRRFVHARALAGNGLGFLGGFGWALLLAIPLCHDELLCTARTPDVVVPRWFAWLAALASSANQRLGLEPLRDPTLPPAALWLAAPSPPARNVARGLTTGTLAIIRDEARLATRRPITDITTDPVDHVLTISGDDERSRGAYEHRFRGLLLDLESAGHHPRPWGRFERDRTSASWRHHIIAAPDARPLVDAYLDTLSPRPHR